MASILYNCEKCCICLTQSNAEHTKNNRLQFNMMNTKTKQTATADLFLCNSCIKINKIKQMTQQEIMESVVSKIHPSVKHQAMEDSGIFNNMFKKQE